MHYMQEKTKEMDSALTNNMEEYRTQKRHEKNGLWLMQKKFRKIRCKCHLH